MFQYSIEKDVKRENSIVYNRLNIYGMIHLFDYSDLYLASFHNGGMIVIINAGECKYKKEMKYYIDLTFIIDDAYDVGYSRICHFSDFISFQKTFHEIINVFNDIRYNQIMLDDIYDLFSYIFEPFDEITDIFEPFD